MLKKFHDVHCHAFNLSHPSFTTLLRRFKLDELFFWLAVFFFAIMIVNYPDVSRIEWRENLLIRNLDIIKTLWALLLVVGIRFGWHLWKQKSGIENLLSYMDGDLGEYFLRMENEINDAMRETGCDVVMNNNAADDMLVNETDCGVEANVERHYKKYDNVIITPLMMDFGSKERLDLKNISKHGITHKPIADQTRDLFQGIKDYKRLSRDQRLLIFPFLGVDPRNYYFKHDSCKRTTLVELLERYFGQVNSNDKPVERFEKLRQAMGKFDFENKKEQSYHFGGIKVYPPLGFNPWPDENEEEVECVYTDCEHEYRIKTIEAIKQKSRDKAEYLYAFCVKHRIPITTHASDNGFLSKKDNYLLSDPANWENVLKKFPTLTLNIAHMGNQSPFLWFFERKEWRETAIRLALKYENVYVDFSNRGTKRAYYDKLKDIIEDNPGIEEKILFGSDFMIDLLHVSSYTDYLVYFLENRNPLTDEQKIKFCSTNTEKFLYGGALDV